MPPSALKSINGTHNSTGVTDENGYVFVSGEFAGKPDVIVQTTTNQIERLVKNMTKKQARFVFARVWTVIKESDTDALYAAGGEPWNDLMDDIIIFYACRLVLFGLCIPCVLNPNLTGSAKKNGNTKFVYNPTGQSGSGTA